MPTSEEIREYQEQHGLGLNEAEKLLTREMFCEELRTDKTVDDIADTLIRILNFEFGNGYDR